jgi:hypothetical protein
MASHSSFNPEYYLNMVDVEDEIETNSPSTISSLEATDTDFDVRRVNDPRVQNDLYDMYEESLLPDFRAKLAEDFMQYLGKHGLSK